MKQLLRKDGYFKQQVTIIRLNIWNKSGLNSAIKLWTMTPYSLSKFSI